MCLEIPLQGLDIFGDMRQGIFGAACWTYTSTDSASDQIETRLAYRSYRVCKYPIHRGYTQKSDLLSNITERKGSANASPRVKSGGSVPFISPEVPLMNTTLRLPAY